MPADQDYGEEESLRHALEALPRPQLTREKQAEMLAVLRGALAERKPTLSGRWFAMVERWVEPSLVVACSGVVFVRLAAVVVRYLSGV